MRASRRTHSIAPHYLVKRKKNESKCDDCMDKYSMLTAVPHAETLVVCKPTFRAVVTRRKSAQVVLTGWTGFNGRQFNCHVDS